MTVRFLATLFVISITSVCAGEDVIWGNEPLTTSRALDDKIVNGSGFGPGIVVESVYALPNVFFDGDRCDNAQPGIVNQVTTWFEDDGLAFGTISGMARLNVFAVPAFGDLPFLSDDPDLGIDVPVTFRQTVVNGLEVIEVQANNLVEMLPEPIRIREGVSYYVGLTPIFVEGFEPFSGNHLANPQPKIAENASAVRRTAPGPPSDWDFAVDGVTNLSLIHI